MEANKITLKTLAISIAAVFAMETLCLLFIAHRFEKNPNVIGLSRSKMLAGLARGLIWSVCFGIAAGALFLVLLAAGINPLKFVNTPLPSAPGQIFIYFLVGGVIAPVSEEIFFRGIIFGFFRRWGVYAAILISTVLFVLPHGRHLPLTQIVGGIVFAIAYEKEKNLMVPVTIHCLGNIAIFSLTFLS